MTVRKTLGIAIVAFVATACEKIDLDAETENGNDTYEQVVPISSGLGTQASPLLPDQIIKGEALPSTPCWVIGYVVGSTYRSMANATFDAETTNRQNILVSSDATCEDTQNCIPVELKTASIQKSISLYHNSHLFRQCVMILGRNGKYLNKNGLRDVQAGYWLPNFDVSSIKTTPTEWQEWNATY